MKKDLRPHFSVLFFALLAVSCTKKAPNCTTLRCGYAIVQDGNYGGQTVNQSGAGCFTSAQITQIEAGLTAAYPSSRYGVSFIQDSTQTQCK